MTNSTHTAEPTSQTEEIQAFDQLPVFLRNRIVNAKYSISSKTVLSLWNVLRNEKGVLQAIEQIEISMEKGEI